MNREKGGGREREDWGNRERERKMEEKEKEETEIVSGLREVEWKESKAKSKGGLRKE